jgi:acetyl esterase/lipase
MIKFMSIKHRYVVILKYFIFSLFLLKSSAFGADVMNQDTLVTEKLVPYLIKTNNPVGAVIVCPGGSYAGLAEHEAGVIAENFNKAGLNSFVLYYTTGTNCYPKPLLELAEAVRYVRSQSEKWNIKSDKIAVCGFSAGGHLVASLGCFFNDPILNHDNLPSCRPDALILCYPVISSGPFGHQYSFDTLLGPNPSGDLKKKMSLENQVHKDFPPVFIWHTMTDKAVPVENSLFFAMALKKQEIPFELLIFPSGEHGLGLAKQDAFASTWHDLCNRWLQVNNFCN